jgi:uncharacterized protein YbaR (Trm112 family)
MTKAENTTTPQAQDSPFSGKPHPQLLEILVCPITKTRLHYDEASGELVSEAAGLAYPIREGIPIMLPEEARKTS